MRTTGPIDILTHQPVQVTEKMFIIIISYYCERFEPRSHFKSRLSLIVRVNVVLNRSVVVDSDWRFDNTINWRDTTHFDSEDDYRAGCRNVSHCQQQQSYSGLRSPGQSNSTYFWSWFVIIIIIISIIIIITTTTTIVNYYLVLLKSLFLHHWILVEVLLLWLSFNFCSF